MRKVLVINPWAGRIGPNTFLLSFARMSLERGNSVQIIYPFTDDFSIELENAGCTLLYFPSIKLQHVSNPVVKLINRVHSECKLFFFLKKLKAEYDYCLVNTELFSFSLSGLRRSLPKYSVVHSLSFVASPKISRIVFYIQDFLDIKLIAVSEAVKKNIKLCNIKSNVTTIYNGVDPQYFKGGGEGAQSRTSKTFKILSVIHPVPHKGALHLIRILAKLSRIHPHIHCTIVGWGSPSRDLEYIQAVEKLIKEFNLERHVTFYNSSKDIRSYYASADLLVHPSESESFGYVLAEAMSFELPVVAFNVGGIPELVSHGLSGYLIEPFSEKDMSDAILAFMTSEDLRKAFGAEGRKIVLEKFDGKRNMATLLDLIGSNSK